MSSEQWMPGSGYVPDPYARQMARAAQVAADAAAVSAAGAASSLTMSRPVVGTATVPALALGASTTITVTVADMGQTGYLVVPILYGSASLLGALQVGGVTARTATQVSVLVRAPLLAVAAGATLTVACWRT